MAIRAGPATYLPRPVFTIPGEPCLAMASFEASMQNSACIAFESRQPGTLREARSTIAIGYGKPFSTGTKAVPAHRTRFGRSIRVFLGGCGKTGPDAGGEAGRV